MFTYIKAQRRKRLLYYKIAQTVHDELINLLLDNGFSIKCCDKFTYGLRLSRTYEINNAEELQKHIKENS